MKDEILHWLAPLSSIIWFANSEIGVDSEVIEYIDEDRNTTKIRVPKECVFCSFTTINSDIKTGLISNFKDLVTDLYNDLGEEIVAKQFVVSNHMQDEITRTSLNNTIRKAIAEFISRFGFIPMRVHVVYRKMKTTATSKACVIVVNKPKHAE